MGWINPSRPPRLILKFSTQPENKCFSHAFKSANCELQKKKEFLHMFLIQLALLNDFYCMQ